MLAPCSMSFMPRHEASCRSFVLGAVTARHGTAARAAVWMAGRRRGSRVRGDGCRRCGWRARWTRSAGCLTPRRSTASSSRRAPAPAGREMCVRLVRGGERDVRPICTGRGERCASGWYGAGREMRVRFVRGGEEMCVRRATRRLTAQARARAGRRVAARGAQHQPHPRRSLPPCPLGPKGHVSPAEATRVSCRLPSPASRRLSVRAVFARGRPRVPPRGRAEGGGGGGAGAQGDGWWWSGTCTAPCATSCASSMRLLPATPWLHAATPWLHAATPWLHAAASCCPRRGGVCARGRSMRFMAATRDPRT